jgi:hypothetical protein
MALIYTDPMACTKPVRGIRLKYLAPSSHRTLRTELFCAPGEAANQNESSCSPLPRLERG